MDLILVRNTKTAGGIFGTLTDIDLNAIGMTLEHSYPSGLAEVPWTAKVAPGAYKCVKHAPNHLPYFTYELQDVPNFQGQPVTGILLHKGNYNTDSDGCILVGSRVENGILRDSLAAFTRFMEGQNGVESFILTIKEQE